MAPNSLPHVRAGTVKAYAVLARTRLAAAPEIPTGGRGRIAGLLHVCLAGTVGAEGDADGRHRHGSMPRSSEALADPAVRSRLADLLARKLSRASQQTPAALGALQKAEIDKWWPIIKAASIKAE